MKQLALLRNDVILVDRLLVANGPLQRMKGLLGCKHLPSGEGVYLEPAPVIHTFFMQFTLDLIFLDASMRVTRYRRNARPFTIVHGGKGARSVVEVESGWLRSDLVGVGDKLDMRERFNPHISHSSGGNN